MNLKRKAIHGFRGLKVDAAVMDAARGLFYIRVRNLILRITERLWNAGYAVRWSITGDGDIVKLNRGKFSRSYLVTFGSDGYQWSVTGVTRTLKGHGRIR